MDRNSLQLTIHIVSRQIQSVTRLVQKNEYKHYQTYLKVKRPHSL